MRPERKKRPVLSQSSGRRTPSMMHRHHQLKARGRRSHKRRLVKISWGALLFYTDSPGTESFGKRNLPEGFYIGELGWGWNLRKIIHSSFRKIFWSRNQGGEGAQRNKEWVDIHFSLVLPNEAIVTRWGVVSQSPSTPRPAMHDCRHITRCKKGQRLVICLLLCFEADGRNSDLQGGIIYI